MPQGFLHQRFTLPRRQVQDPQILAVRIGRPLFDQSVVGHAKVARRKQLLPIAVVRERARFANQPIDDMPVVDAMLVAATQSGQTLDELLRVPHFQVFDEDADLDFFPDQPARHRVAVAVHVNQTAAIDARPQTFARLQPPRRQGTQGRTLFGQALAPAGVELSEQLPQEDRIVFPAGEVPAAAQHQRLSDGGLEAMVPLLDVAVLVRMIRLDLLARHPVMGQECLITTSELLFIR